MDQLHVPMGLPQPTSESRERAEARALSQREGVRHYRAECRRYQAALHGLTEAHRQALAKIYHEQAARAQKVANLSFSRVEQNRVSVYLTAESGLRLCTGFALSALNAARRFDQENPPNYGSHREMMDEVYR